MDDEPDDALALDRLSDPASDAFIEPEPLPASARDAECDPLPVDPELVRPLRLLPEPELLSCVVASAQPAVVQLPSAPPPPSARLASLV